MNIKCYKHKREWLKHYNLLFDSLQSEIDFIRWLGAKAGLKYTDNEIQEMSREYYKQKNETK